MSEMVGRVARAIYGSSYNDADGLERLALHKDAVRAIGAMREPTEAMVNSEALPYSPAEMINYWQVMIDEALK